MFENNPFCSLTVTESDLPTNLGALKQRISINHLIKKHGISQTMRRKLRSHGRFLINDNEANWDTLLCIGDTLKVFFSAEQSLQPYALQLDICYEDAYLLIINKPPQLLMHPTATVRHTTLANAVQYYYERTQQQNARFHPVHRLDKNTSGLVVIAKSALIQHQFTQRHIAIHKVYDGIVSGAFPPTCATIHWPIGRREGSIIERQTTQNGKLAHTDIHYIKSNANYSWLRFYLHTGRTHQIRVHASHLGYPLLGDDLYGGLSTYITRQALHAAELHFIHPITSTMLHIYAPLPEDMKRLIEDL